MSWDDPPPTQQANKKLPGGLQDQGHEVVHHDQGEGYQQPDSQVHWVFIFIIIYHYSVLGNKSLEQKIHHRFESI